MKETLINAAALCLLLISLALHMLRTSLAQKRQVNLCTPADYGQRPECLLADKPKEEKSIFSFF